MKRTFLSIMLNTATQLVMLGGLVILSSCGGKTEQDPSQTAVVQDVALGQIVAVGRVEPEGRLTTINSEVSGLITDIMIKAGDTVKAGQVLLKLSQTTEAAQVNLASSRLTTTRQDMQTTSRQIESAALKVANLQQRLERLKPLVAQGAETQQSVDNLETDLKQAQIEVERLKSAYATSQAKLNEQNADLAVAQSQLAKRTIYAPSDGQILTFDLTFGRMLNAGASICDFAPASSLTTLVEVDELFANKVFLGQKALIRTQGEADTLAMGEVIYAAPALKKKSIFSDESSNLEDRRVREVRIKVQEGKQLLFNSRVEVILFVKASSTKKA